MWLVVRKKGRQVLGLFTHYNDAIDNARKASKEPFRIKPGDLFPKDIILMHIPVDVPIEGGM